MASLINDCKFVPIRDRQKTAMSTDPFAKPVWAISHAVTCSLIATKSNEWIFTLGNALASLASPHPKSATTTGEVIFDFFKLQINKSFIKNAIYTKHINK